MGMSFWKTPEWKTIQKTITDDIEVVVPEPRLIFRPLIATPLKSTKVAFILPEPYFIRAVSNGLALSVNQSEAMRLHGWEHSPFLFHQFMQEYKADLGLNPPKSGDLSPWTRQGVLLWNSTPTTKAGYYGGHRSLPWGKLTQEILETIYLVNPDCVFVFVGTHHLYHDVLPYEAQVIKMVLPSPQIPSVRGSELFSNINMLLHERGHKKINWALK